MKAAVVSFPGSNCDRDMAVALKSVTGADVDMVWHGETSLEGADFIALPGGFSYGDYLRCGAMASRAHIIPAVIEAASRGVPIIGVCNGFQILTEIGLLPGALMRNRDLKFICRDISIEVAENTSPFTAGYSVGQQLTIPVAHHDGNYYADGDTVARLKGDGRVAFRYADNINGSVDRIAGILSENRRVLGMMPHPERAIDMVHGGTDGKALFEALLTIVSA